MQRKADDFGSIIYVVLCKRTKPEMRSENFYIRCHFQAESVSESRTSITISYHKTTKGNNWPFFVILASPEQ